MVGADQPIVACPLPPSSDPPWPPLPPWAPLPTVVVATQQGRAGLRLKQRTRVCYRVGWWVVGVSSQGMRGRCAFPLCLAGFCWSQHGRLARHNSLSWPDPSNAVGPSQLLQFRGCTQHHQQPPPSSIRVSSIWEGPPPLSQNLFSPLVRPNLHILARLDTSAR